MCPHACLSSSPGHRTPFWLDWAPLVLHALSILLSLVLVVVLCVVTIDRETFYTGSVGLASSVYTVSGSTLAVLSGALTLANMSCRGATDQMRKIVRNGWLISTGLFLAMLLIAGTLIQLRLA